MPLRTIVPSLALVCALALAGTAGAITGGQPDNGAHPMVGLVLVPLGPGHTEACSGVLVAQNLLVTAAHCFPNGPQHVVVSSTDAPRTMDGFIPGFGVPDPQFAPPSHDLAVVALRPGILPAGYPSASLPALGLADQLGNHAEDTIVGYGVTGFTHLGDLTGANPGGPLVPDPALAFVRSQATTSILPSNDNLSSEFVKLSGGRVGTCFGDSGGPHFIRRSEVIVSVTSWGDANCRALDQTQRIDVPGVRSFLRRYVDLP
jgi:hypothetical protein